MHPSQPRDRRIPANRRTFLAGTGVGLLTGLPVGYLGSNWLQEQVTTTPKTYPPVVEGSKVTAMPGNYPGRVIEVRHPAVVSSQHEIDRNLVGRMVDVGMCRLTGSEHPHEAWKAFFEPSDVIGIKVNPVGTNRRNRRVVGAISSPELVLEVVRNLKQIGVPGKNILLFDRYAREFVDAGYADLLTTREMSGVRWYACSAVYTDEQLAIDGIEDPTGHSPELLAHVVGYDPDAFVEMGFASPQHSQRDDRRFRSHLSNIVTKMVNKLITLPVLKDHRSAGVTLSLKNMSHGMNNNVARSHIGTVGHGAPDSVARETIGPNQCNTFIPAAVNQAALRSKATLHILDGLIGVYEGGPGNWNRSWATWRYGSLFFATDPVAMDHVGWDIIDRKRLAMHLPRVGAMGRDRFRMDQRMRMALAEMASGHAWQSLVLAPADVHVRATGDTEVFDRRQPEHIFLAGTIGLGEFTWANIRHEIQSLPS